MADSLADVIVGVVLAAGEGRRLRPLSALRPKALCPIGATTLAERAIAQVGAVTGTPVLVNVHHGRDQMEARLGGRRDVLLSIEEPEALGTAGALALMADVLDERSALVVNADTVHAEDLRSFVSEWDGQRVRVLAIPQPDVGGFGPRSGVVASIVPWDRIRELAATPSGLWEVLWRDESAAGRLDAVLTDGTVIDCGTPAQYLQANLWLSGGRPVFGEGAVVRGAVERSVVWPGAVVDEGESLVDAIRADHRTTVLVR